MMLPWLLTLLFLACCQAEEAEKFLILVRIPPGTPFFGGRARRLSEVANNIRASLLAEAEARAPRRRELASNINGSLAGVSEDGTAQSLDFLVDSPMPCFTIVAGFAAVLSPSAKRYLLATWGDASLPNSAIIDIVPDEVVFAASNGVTHIVHATSTFTESALSWGQDRIDQGALPLNGEYLSSGVGSGVDVYIADSGARLTHAQLAGQVGLADRSANFDLSDTPKRATGAGSDVSDCAGHGTHLAGTLSGATVGIAPGASLSVVRIYGCSASGPVSQVLAGFDFILQRMRSRPGVPAVINLSFATHRVEVLDDAVTALAAAGAFVSCAGGNSHTDACDTSPAALPVVFTSSSSDETDAFSSFSDYGRCILVAAPGAHIVSAFFGDDRMLATMSGTSMAAPHVSGVLALLLEAHPTLTVAEAQRTLRCSASAIAVTDATAFAAGQPPLLLFSSPHGVAAACLPSALPSAPISLQTGGLQPQVAATPSAAFLSPSFSPSPSATLPIGFSAYTNAASVGADATVATILAALAAAVLVLML
jgi:subtilisin family serine protease